MGVFLLTIMAIINCMPCMIDDPKNDDLEIANLSSPNDSVREAAFLRLIKKPPESMEPLIAIVRNLRPSLNEQGKKYYRINDAPHYAIRLLGRYQVVDAIGVLVDQIGYSPYDQIATHTGAYPSIVQALCNIGKPCIQQVLVKLSTLKQDGIKRHHCLVLLTALHGQDSSKVSDLISEKINDRRFTIEEKDNLRAARRYLIEKFHQPHSPYQDDWYWR